jgi:hypothetical protein
MEDFELPVEEIADATNGRDMVGIADDKISLYYGAF